MMNNRIEKFNYDYPDEDYYSLGDVYVNNIEIGQRVLLGPKGKALMKDYYDDKFHTNIKLVAANQLDKIIELIEEEKKAHAAEPNYRITFIVDMETSSGFHSLPLIYVKENGEEGVLISDSNSSRSLEYDQFAENLLKKTNISTYVTTEDRQLDGFSCHVDAILYGKYATAWDKEKNDYLTPNILSTFKKGAEKKGKHEYYEVSALSYNFLKTAQIKNFVTKYATKDTIKDITSFLEKHRRNYNAKGVSKIYDDFLRKKGLAFANLIEIQFYVNQLKKLLPHAWPKLNDPFMERAKKIFGKNSKNNTEDNSDDEYEDSYESNHEQLFNLANQFLANPEGPINKRQNKI